VDAKVSKDMENQVMKATKRTELEEAYLLNIEPCLTPEEVRFCKKIFHSSEEERNLYMSEHNRGQTSTLLKAISNKLKLSIDDDEPLEDLYAYLVLEYRTWEQRIFIDSSEKELNQQLLEDVFLNAVALLKNRKLGTSEDFLDVVQNIKAQFNEHIDDGISGHHLTHPFSIFSYALIRQAENESGVSPKYFASSLLAEILAIIREKDDEDLNQKQFDSENRTEHDGILYDYCARLLLALDIRSNMSPEILLAKSRRAVLSKTLGPGENQSAAIRYAAFLFCQEQSPCTDLVVVQAEKNPSRDAKIDSRLKRIFGFLNQSFHLEDEQSSILKKFEVVYKTRRYYELFYQTPSILRTKMGLDEFGDLIDESIDNGFLSFVIDEIDLIVKSEDKTLDTCLSINDGWMSICVEYSSDEKGYQPGIETFKAEKDRLVDSGVWRFFDLSSTSPLTKKVEEFPINYCYRENGEANKDFSRSTNSSFKVFQSPVDRRSELSNFREKSKSRKKKLSFSVISPLKINLAIGLSAIIAVVYTLPNCEWLTTAGLSILSGPAKNTFRSDMSTITNRSTQLDSEYKKLLEKSSVVNDFAAISHHDKGLAKNGMSKALEEIPSSLEKEHLVEIVSTTQGEHNSIAEVRENSFVTLAGEMVYTASWYGSELQDNVTASGELFDPGGLTIAHPSLPFNTKVEVRNPATDKSIIARVTDRPPTKAERIVVLSFGLADELDMDASGITSVVLSQVTQ
jgi:rare lipoprotein A (peptidoglycan hydrolase)